MSFYKKLKINADLADELQSNQSSLVAMKGDISSHELEITFTDSTEGAPAPNFAGWELAVGYTGLVDNYSQQDIFTMVEADSITVPVTASAVMLADKYTVQLTLTSPGGAQVVTVPKFFSFRTKEKALIDAILEGESELDHHVETVNKPALEAYTTAKKGELDTHEAAKEVELNALLVANKGELDSHKDIKKSELDAHEAAKEGELETFTLAKKGEITDHTVTKKGELDTKINEAEGKRLELVAKIGETTATITSINNAGATQITSVEAEGNTQVSAVGTKGTEQIAAVTAEGNTQTSRVNTEGNARITAITAQANVEISRVRDEVVDQVGLVTTEGTTQIAAVGAKGDAEIAEITSHTNTKKAEITTEKDNAVAAVEAVKAQAEAIVQGDPEGGNAIALGGKTRAEYDAEIAVHTEQIQNCLVELKDVVAVVSHKGIYGVAGKNVIDKGGRVLEGDGFSCVVTEDGFGIGEGYENLATRQATNSSSITHTIKESIYEIEATATTDSNSYVQLSQAVIDMITETDYTLSWEVLEGYENFRHISSSVDAFGSNNFHTAEEGTITRKTAATFSGSVAYRIYMLQDLPAGTKLKIKLSITKTSNKVPFVPHGCRDGKMLLNGDYSSRNYTIIMTGVKFGQGSNNRRYLTTYPYSANYIAYGSSSFMDEKHDAIISNSYSKAILKDGSELDINITDAGSSIYSTAIGRPGHQVESISELQAVIWIEGDLGEQKAKETLALIKSGNFQLPPYFQGTILPVEGMARRGDKYGIVNDIIEVTDLSRDLWYIELGLYEIIDNNLVTHYVRVNVDGSITGTALEDVSGRLRVAAAIALPAQVRKVK